MLLNLPAFEPKLTESSKGIQIFDPIRKKWVQLTNEEWVRQHILNYLISKLGISKNLIAVEKALQFNNQKKRFDICVYNNNAKPLLLIECKAFDVVLTPDSILQIITYNQVLQVPVLWISNGMKHISFKLNNSMEFEFYSDGLML